MSEVKTPRVAASARAIEEAIKSPDFAALTIAVLAGLPIKRLDEFQRRSGLPWDALSRVLHLPPRTLARRRKAGRLSPAESDRLVRIFQLFERTVTLLDGDV